jgi:hypothetical protein
MTYEFGLYGPLDGQLNVALYYNEDSWDHDKTVWFKSSEQGKLYHRIVIGVMLNVLGFKDRGDYSFTAT